VNKQEVAAVLAMIASLDGRKAFGEVDVVAWNAVIDDLRFEDARLAVIAHYRVSTDPLMPASLRKQVGAIRSERIQRQGLPECATDLAADEYTGWLKAIRSALGDGLTSDEAKRLADDKITEMRGRQLPAGK
jgi:hypothetical protein